MVKISRDLHPVTNSKQSKKRKRKAFEALHKMEDNELYRKDGLMSPVKKIKSNFSDEGDSP